MPAKAAKPDKFGEMAALAGSLKPADLQESAAEDEEVNEEAPEDEEPEDEDGDAVEEEAVEGGEAEDARGAAGERAHAGAAVLHDGLVVGDGGLAEGLHLACLVYLGSHSVTGHLVLEVVLV